MHQVTLSRELVATGASVPVAGGSETPIDPTPIVTVLRLIARPPPC